MLAIEVFSLESLWTIKNTSIPKRIHVNDKKRIHIYNLMGIVDFREFHSSQGESTQAEKELTAQHEKVKQTEELTCDGHYVALSLRQKEVWEEYDDLKSSPKVINRGIDTVPHLILYSRL